MFTFCPLQGALSESAASQSLLELDGGVKVLVDLGWDESFDVAKLKELEKQVPTLSLILLTHATTSHLAAYAYCCKNFPLFTRIPVYATRPVVDLGRTLLQDLYASTPLAAATIPASSLSQTSYSFSQNGSARQDFLLQAPTNDEIARYFSLIQALKYSQPHQPLSSPFSPPLNGLTITAYNSGHTLGGTIWHIQHGLESIVYAVDWNQARENVFAGAAWLGGAGGGGVEVIEQLRKPTALVCSSRGADSVAQAGGRAKRDEQLIEMIRTCVSRGGTALIPVDSSARVLELAYLLEHAWRMDPGKDGGASLRAAKLYLCGKSVNSTMRFARSMLEWMDDNIVREFEASADASRRANGSSDARHKEGGPFSFKYLRLLEKKAQVEKLLSQELGNAHAEGRVILASDSSVEWGFSRDAIKRLAKDSRNLVILTEKPGLGADDKPSIARTLWDWWTERKDGVQTETTSSGDPIELVFGGGRELEIVEAKRQPLEGDELAAYQQWLATQRQLQATLSGGSTALEPGADVFDDASSESSSESEDSDTEQQGKALNISTTMGQAGRKKIVLNDEDLGVNVLIKRKGVFDFDIRTKKGRDRMFPVVVRRKRYDDYGEVIRPEEYLRAEEREKEDGLENGLDSGEADDARLGRKRKWNEGGDKRPPLNRNISDDVDVLVTTEGQQPADEFDGVEDDEPAQRQDAQGPAKLVRATERVVFIARVGFVDLSGRHDKRSLNMLIPLIQPRKLILVSGGRDETLALAADCRRALAAQVGAASDDAVPVFAPRVGERVDASVDTHAWTLKLADALVRRLQWQKVRGLSVATVTGRLLGLPAGEGDAAAAERDEGANKRLKAEGGEAAAADADGPGAGEDEQTNGAAGATVVPVLDVLPAGTTSAARSSAPPLHVGELRLTDLRRTMQGRGHAAEFRGEGTLVVDGTVVVRKAASGRVELATNGAPGPQAMLQAVRTFREVRQVIYDGLAVVEGA